MGEKTKRLEILKGRRINEREVVSQHCCWLSAMGSVTQTSTVGHPPNFSTTSVSLGRVCHGLMDL